MLPFTPVSTGLARVDMSTPRTFSFTPATGGGTGAAVEVPGGTRSRLHAMESEYKVYKLTCLDFGSVYCLNEDLISRF